MAKKRLSKSIIRLVLPYPPSINHYYIKGRILTKKARAYREAVYLEVLRQISIGPAPALTGALSLSVLLHKPDERKRDLINVIKPLEDAMQYAYVYKDDNQIKEYGFIGWGEAVKGGRVEVGLEEM